MSIQGLSCLSHSLSVFTNSRRIILSYTMYSFKSPNTFSIDQLLWSPCTLKSKLGDLGPILGPTTTQLFKITEEKTLPFITYVNGYSFACSQTTTFNFRTKDIQLLELSY